MLYLKLTILGGIKVIPPRVPILIFVLFATDYCWSQGPEYEGINDIFVTSPASDIELPTVLIALLIRNKAHTLPYFLTLLEGLDYSKERIALWIRSDHNEDATVDILGKWLSRIEKVGEYASIFKEIVDSPPFRQQDQEEWAVKWSPLRFQHIINLKEEALRTAKKVWANFVWFLDADAFIVNNQTLKHLIMKQKRVVAPMLITGGLYSNFWGGMDNYYYKRTDSYKEILHRKKIGCFEVPMVHTAVLVNLVYKSVPGFRHPMKVNDSNPVPEDDIIRFAINAKNLGIPIEICNDLEYGALLTPLDDQADLTRDAEQLYNLRTEVSAYWSPPMTVSEELKTWEQVDPTASNVGFEKVYLINLKRRPDRLSKMKNTLKILGIQFQLMEATDGKELPSIDQLKDFDIQPLPEYRDPYSKRVMTYGEIGCFLSHYRVWKDMLKMNSQVALILEDDIRFEPNFIFQMQKVFQESRDLELNWDLMYLGRKRPANAKEPFVSGSQFIVEVGYSYWTLGYAITLDGVKKLIDAKPLKKLIPIDEFLPIMFNKHTNQEWISAFPVRNLRAFSAEPLLLYPTHYTGENGYVSDTEQSTMLNLSLKKNCSIKNEL